MVIARVALDAGSGAISSPGQVPWTSSSVAPQRRNHGRAASRPVAIRAAPEATVPIVPIFAFMGDLPKPEKSPAPVRTMAKDAKKVAGPWGGGGGRGGVGAAEVMCSCERPAKQESRGTEISEG